MLWTRLKKIADRASKAKVYTNQNFQFHFHYQIISKKKSLSKYKIHNSYYAMYCPDGLLVELRVYQAKRPDSNPTCLIFFLLFLTLFSLQTDAKKVFLHVFTILIVLKRH